ncbi:GDSL esterase/lipase [Platanthera zijinensis]|uniref:GDSL esterase/lipase n=1 Tax=Platanthera zijinensis TaxID=2320716 RepID=A0AAP0BXA5_9ASPA
MAGLLLLLFLLCSIPTEGFGQKTAGQPSMYVFGDSLADVGNNNHLLTLLKADFPHNGVDFAGGKATGRFSNGKNAPDFLAEKLGFPSPPPYLAISSSPNKAEAFLNGINFASAGAGILDSTHRGECLSFNKQIDYFSVAYASMAELIGVGQAQTHLSKSLFTIIIGSNDIFAFKSDGKATPQQYVGSLISTLQLQLLKMYNIGARKFVFIGTGPLGCTPAERSTNINGDCNALANNVSDLYNQASAYLLQVMMSQLGDLRYTFFDTSLLLQQIIQNPCDYGFTEVKAGCCGLGNLNAKVACTPLSSLCPNRKEYVFWDLYHPTEAADDIIVNKIVDGASPFVYPVNARRLAAF